MSRLKKYASCPKCCPDGPHACFAADMREDDSGLGYLSYHWICNNCGYNRGPVRRIKASGRLTPSQRSVIKMLRKAFGGVASWKLVGRKAFVKLYNPRRKWYDGTSAHGTVGPLGAYEIHHWPLGMSERLVTNAVEVSVYLDAKVK